MKEKIDMKLCGVCGDKALGYNFNAVTCESCKAFFRRNALLQKPFVCPFNQQCEITTITRRFCQKCRLDKCFAIGMCKDLIMSEQDKVKKRQKIEENRARKKSTSGFKQNFKKMKKELIEPDSQDGSSFTVSTDSEDTCPEQQYPQSFANSSFVPASTYSEEVNDVSHMSPAERLVSSSSDNVSMIRSMLNANNEGQPLQAEDGSLHSTLISNSPAGASNHLYNPSDNSNIQSNNSEEAQVMPTKSNNTLDVTKDVIQEVQRIQVEPNSIESILCEAIKLEFEAYTSIAQCYSNSRELNDAERAKLNELIVANKALLAPIDDDINNLMGKDNKFRTNCPQSSSHSSNSNQTLLDVINLTAIGIRRLIKMAKKINAFKNLCQEDQVALLKGGCTEIMVLRSAMNYDPSKQSWKIPHTQENLNINVEVLKLAKGNLYQEHERFMKTFDAKWRTDENIVLILMAITLFTPDRLKVVHQDVIKLEQNSYYYLLRRYLESIYHGCEAKSTFLKLIQKISDLHRFNEELINVYLDVNPSQVEPLLIEIFDLKH